jgi:hypothetical protein
MDVVFDNDGTNTAVCSVRDQLIRGLKFDAVAVAPKLGHQVRSPPSNARPTEVVDDLVDDFVGDDVEEVLAINEVV